MMRYGHYLGTIDWKTDVIHLMGSEKNVLTKNIQDKILKEIMQNNGILNIKEEEKF